MLIGIMRRSAGEDGWASEYEFKILLKCTTITRTREISTHETLLRELIIFKEKYEENEQNLVSLWYVIHFFFINFISVIQLRY
jgi:hypothetical protein